MGVDPQSYFSSDILLYMKFRMLSTTRYILWDSVGRTFIDFAMSKCVVTDYHIGLLQMINVFELANLSISY